jgi:nicotinamidase-related amidase
MIVRGKEPPMLTPETAFLVVIDVQGKLAEIVDDAPALRRNVVRLIEGTSLFDLPIVATEQAPEKLGETVVEVRAALGDRPRLTKVTFSCGADEGIRAAFSATGRRQAIVCGIECHVCVYQTVMDLLADGFEVHLVADAVSSRAAANKGIAIARMAAEGAKITSTEMALFELKHDCLGDDFRKLSRLVR